MNVKLLPTRLIAFRFPYLFNIYSKQITYHDRYSELEIRYKPLKSIDPMQIIIYNYDSLFINVN